MWNLYAYSPAPNKMGDCGGSCTLLSLLAKMYGEGFDLQLQGIDLMVKTCDFAPF